LEGTPFGRYRLIELLGHGGMGEVWRAHDAETDRIVAIKVLPAHLSEDEEFQRRFRREAHAAARLNSPHVIPIHHYGEIDGRLYLDMRLIKGRDLATVLADGPLDPTRAVNIVGQVAKALHAAHEDGLLHRDIKPSNILLDRDDFAYLIDFGIARTIGETRMTQTGNAIGTFHYIAPERLAIGADEDVRADIYSLACVLYECLTGSPPFPGDTTPQLIAAHLNATPPRPSITQPNVPAAVDEVIATGMAKEPDDRYATTVELANAAHDAITTPLAPPAATLLGDATRPAYRPARRDSQVPPAPSARKQSATPQRPLGSPPAPPPRPAYQALPQIDVPPVPGEQRPPRRLKSPMIAAAIVVVLAAASIAGYLLLRPKEIRATALPFIDLNFPWDVAVDRAGNVYVTDTSSNRVVKQAAGSSSQTELPFAGLNYPVGVAVDSAGDVYITDQHNSRVLELPAGSSSQTELPFTGLGQPDGVAVDPAGNLYVADWDIRGNTRVLKLAASSSTPVVLPFTGLSQPAQVAVDAVGNVMVTDLGKSGVLKLAAGSSIPTLLPFSIDRPQGLAVDSEGAVYVADINNRVVKLAAGSSSQSVLPFTGLNWPAGMAVDAAGNLYVTDHLNSRVVKLPVR
jgi:serine/threonine-protein kinase